MCKVNALKLTLSECSSFVNKFANIYQQTFSLQTASNLIESSCARSYTLKVTLRILTEAVAHNNAFDKPLSLLKISTRDCIIARRSNFEKNVSYHHHQQHQFGLQPIIVFFSESEKGEMFICLSRVIKSVCYTIHDRRRRRKSSPRERREEKCFAVIARARDCWALFTRGHLPNVRLKAFFHVFLQTFYFDDHVT